MPSLILNPAIDFFARVVTGLWPVIAVTSRVAASMARAFWRASPSPMLTTTLLRLGTCMLLE